jgi:hypothetical protein
MFASIDAASLSDYAHMRMFSIYENTVEDLGVSVAFSSENEEY